VTTAAEATPASRRGPAWSGLIPPRIRTSAYARLYHGTLWSLAGTVAAQGSVVLASVLIARLLGKEQFGALAIVQNTAGVLGIFAGIGFGTTCTKYVAQLRTTDPERAGRIVGLSTAVTILLAGLFAAVLLMAAPWLASNTLAAPKLAGELRVASLLLFFTALSGAQSGTLAGLEAFKNLAALNLVRGVTALPLSVAAAWLWGVRGAIWSLTAAAAVACILGHIEVRRACSLAGIRITLAHGAAERSVVWHFSIPAALAGAMTGPALWIAYSILVHQPAGYGGMGAFNAANQWRNAILFLPNVFSQPLLPVLSDLYGRQSPEFRRVLWTAMTVTASVSALIAIPIAFGAPWIMALYGPGFRSSWPALSLLAASTTPAASCSVIGQAIAGSGHQCAGFSLNLLWASVLLGATVLLTPRQGAIGLSEAILCAYAMHVVTVSVFTLLAVKHAGRRW